MGRWTEADIPAQTGRVAVVTGANTGLGYETARALAAKGATVVMTARNLEKGSKAQSRILTAHPDARLELEELDLASLASVQAFADRVKQHHPKIHLLINNAGVMAIPRRETLDGFEMQLGTNHLGHFALTGLLLEPLTRAGREDGDARIVTVSSLAHRQGKMDFDDLMGKHSYQPWAAYGQSKLANLLFTRELDRRLREAELPITAVAAHPGYSDTDLQRRGPEMEGSRWKLALMNLLNRFLGQPADRGALPQLYAATAEDVEGNDFIGPDGFLEMRGWPTRVTPRPKARSDEDSRRLWTVSAELTGVDYPALGSEEA